MATNEILLFAETDTGSNLLTQVEYDGDAQRPIGNQPGVARSKLVNKALRQSSLIASGVAEFLADNQSNNITDGLTPQNIADYLAAVVRSTGLPTAVAGGTSDAITADFTPNVALTNGTTVIVRAGAANTTATPTFAPDGLTAKTIVKGNNIALAVGDISGDGHWLEMNFDTVLDKWVLQNPVVTQASDTRAGVLRVATQTETNAGTADDRVVTPKKLRWGVSYLIAANGYIVFPSWLGGVIIQWGQAASSVAGDVSVTFPISFPAGVKSMSMLHMHGTTSSAYINSVATYNSSAFSFSTFNLSAARVAQNSGWIAIGS